MKTEMQWDILQSAVTGCGHEWQGLPCQDRTAALSEGDCHVISLADGAGSARLSHEGAECVAQSMCRYLCREFDRLYETPHADSVRAEVMALLHRRLGALAVELDCSMQELASTLLVAAVKGGRYILLHLGDGLIAFRRYGRMLPASLPVNGEYANCTVFTTSTLSGRDMRLIKGELGDIEGFALMSDGSCASLFDKAEKAPAPVLGWLMDLCTYLPAHLVECGLQESMENEVRMVTEDDCSLAILARRQPDFCGLATLSRAVLMRLIGLPATSPQSRRRLRVYLRILAALARPRHLRSVQQEVHQKRSHLLKKLVFLLRCRLVEKLPDGRYVTRARL